MKLPENLSLEEAKKLLWNLKIYADMSQKLWNRGRKLFQRKLHNTRNFVVEYFPAFWEDAAWEQAQTVFKKSFSMTPKREEVIFLEKEGIKGWMKIYVDDNMVDVSFTKVERLMQK